MLEGSSVNAVAKKYNIPEASLRKYKNGKQPGKRGGQAILPPDIEQEIVVWLQKCAERGKPQTKGQLLETVCKIRRRISGNPEVQAPTKAWTEGFMKRNSNISLRIPQAITKSSAVVTEADIRRWFETITSYMTKENLLHLLNDASRFINCDETGFELNAEPGKVLAQKGGKNVNHVEAAGPSERISVMYTFGADGYSFSPQIILKNTVSRNKIHEMTMQSVGKLKNYNCSKILSNLSSFILACGGNFSFCRTEKGFQTRESFESYVKNIIVPELDRRGITRDEQHRVFLYLDNHKSHTGFDFSKYCAENFIELITFYPNSTRILQACDVGLFSPAKSSWKKALQRWKTENSNEILNEVKVVKLLKQVNDEFIKTQTIKNGFRVTGIYPFNVEAVMYDRLYGSSSVVTAIQDDFVVVLDLQTDLVVAPALQTDLVVVPALQTDPAVVPALQNDPSVIPVLQNDFWAVLGLQNDSLAVPVSISDFSKSLNEVEKQFKNFISPFVAKNHPTVALIVQGLRTQLQGLKTVVITEALPTTATSSMLGTSSTPESATELHCSFSSSQAQTEQPASSVLSSILKSPRPFKRVGIHRNYKLQNFGVMSDKGLLNRIEEDAQKKEEEKMHKERLRNMKKEKAEENKREKAEKQSQRQQKRKVPKCPEEPPKKRGRPKLLS